MTASLFAAALFVASTTAQLCGGIEGSSGQLMSGPSGNARYPGPVEEIIETANENPNATSSVTFNFTTSASINGVFTQEWTWRVNISEVSTVGFNGSFSGSGSFANEQNNNTSLTNTVHDLQWPGGGYLNDYLHNATNNATGAAGTLCAAVVDLSGLPYNVSNNYHDSDNGDCSNALGAECVAAVLRGMPPVQNSGSCPTVGDLSSYPECNSTLSVSTCGYGSSAIYLGNSTTLNQSLIQQRENQSDAGYPYESGLAMYYRASGAHQTGNLTWYHESTQVLQAIVLSGATQRTMLCQKVNKTAATVASDGSPVPGQNVGSAYGVSSAAVLGLAGLTVLFAI
ncbi:hypothetical protein HII31_01462 [Pseudocercospora fuligena]|uniref:Uncharacterized protein n=1 Tax=Pseudocercospora fuligena TaxID=685502 RepID=A0A8H6VNQ8_9PEZI|nr:hypothetical protein HII31_01462 [Pseudocercospora fuligena]